MLKEWNMVCWHVCQLVLVKYFTPHVATEAFWIFTTALVPKRQDYQSTELVHFIDNRSIFQSLCVRVCCVVIILVLFFCIVAYSLKVTLSFRFNASSSVTVTLSQYLLWKSDCCLCRLVEVVVSGGVGIMGVGFYQYYCFNESKPP